MLTAIAFLLFALVIVTMIGVRDHHRPAPVDAPAIPQPFAPVADASI